MHLRALLYISGLHRGVGVTWVTNLSSAQGNRVKGRGQPYSLWPLKVLIPPRMAGWTPHVAPHLSRHPAQVDAPSAPALSLLGRGNQGSSPCQLHPWGNQSLTAMLSLLRSHTLLSPTHTPCRPQSQLSCYRARARRVSTCSPARTSGSMSYGCA